MSKGSLKERACWTPSPLLKLALSASERRQYEWAQAIPVHRTTLSALLRGIVLVRRDDSRIARLARLLGVPRDKALVRRGAPMVRPTVNPAAVAAAARLAARQASPGIGRRGAWASAARGRTLVHQPGTTEESPGVQS